MTRTLLSLILVLTIAGCKKQPPEPAPADLAPVAAKATPMSQEEAVVAMQEQFARVHFEFDSSTLDAPSKEALAANAAILQRHPRLSIEVQGHADERGTTDYNLALGQKRAASVQSYLGSVGVGASRVTTVSYGEEAPLERTNDDVAWSKNRRCEFRILVGEAGVEGSTR